MSNTSVRNQYYPYLHYQFSVCSYVPSFATGSAQYDRGEGHVSTCRANVSIALGMTARRWSIRRKFWRECNMSAPPTCTCGVALDAEVEAVDGEVEGVVDNAQVEEPDAEAEAEADPDADLEACLANEEFIEGGRLMQTWNQTMQMQSHWHSHYRSHSQTPSTTPRQTSRDGESTRLSIDIVDVEIFMSSMVYPSLQGSFISV
ncbi:hypothetical protein ARMGADRAFT_1031175 [Armillaria gallica]|uniref:Uncharacterized protein n=1 Tax=Armillaria gallica TaxID=47427 RepID=A0A2H3DXV9_ARMGA|nr:hypothetical protein ARMGADRAFT_1031175 [Armillaria gallica]